MTSDELISSGILEAYVLGVADPEDELTVNTLLSEPGVAEEIMILSQALERFAQESALTPPPWATLSAHKPLTGIEK